MVNNQYKEKVQTEIDTYFRVLHEADQKGGHFTYVSAENMGKADFGDINYVSRCAAKKILNEGTTVFISLNVFNPRVTHGVRRTSNLWGMDCFMIDIDNHECPALINNDYNLYNKLKELWETLHIVPEPNMIMFTGSGGLHVYYTFKRLPSQMGDAVKTLKKKYFELFASYVDGNTDLGITDVDGVAHCYKVDTSIADHARYDRIGGSIHKKTKRIATCLPTGAPRRTIQELFKAVGIEDHIEEYKTKKAVTNKVSKLKKKKNKRKTNRITMPNTFVSNERVGDIVWNNLHKKRLKAITSLIENNPDCTGRRDKLLFAAVNAARQIHLNQGIILSICRNLNSKFTNPLEDYEINKILCNKTLYKFTNDYLFDFLDLSEEEIKFFTKKKKFVNRREKTFKKRVLIAKEVKKGKSIHQISDATGISVSTVKRMRVYIKSHGGFLFWSLECNINRYKQAITEFLNKLKETGEKLTKVIPFVNINTKIINFVNNRTSQNTEMSFGRDGPGEHTVIKADDFIKRVDRAFVS